MSEEPIEKVRPWALVLKDMLEAVDRGSKISFLQMIKQFCIIRGVKYPPEDVERDLYCKLY